MDHDKQMYTLIIVLVGIVLQCNVIHLTLHLLKRLYIALFEQYRLKIIQSLQQLLIVCQVLSLLTTWLITLDGAYFLQIIHVGVCACSTQAC